MIVRQCGSQHLRGGTSRLAEKSSFPEGEEDVNVEVWPKLRGRKRFFKESANGPVSAVIDPKTQRGLRTQIGICAP